MSALCTNVKCFDEPTTTGRSLTIAVTGTAAIDYVESLRNERDSLRRRLNSALETIQSMERASCRSSK